MVAVAAGYVATTHALAFGLRNRAQAVATQLAPYDGRFLALRAAALSGVEASPRDRQEADLLARRALRADATAVVAVSTLVINAQVRNDTAQARRYFAYAEMLSRRDLQARLWAISDAVAANDVPAALRHYDLTLRTSPKIANLLFPVLGDAISEPEIRTGLVKTLAARPQWADGFFGYLGDSSKDPGSAARLLAELHAARVAVPAEARAKLVNVLFARGDHEGAWRLYTLATPDLDPARSRQPRLTPVNGLPSAFDWTPVEGDGIATSIDAIAGGGTFDFSLAPSAGGAILTQAQRLPAGRYRLSGRSADVSAPVAKALYWQLRCTDGRELGRVALTPTSDNGGSFAGELVVPGDCPAQSLALVARPTDMIEGLTGRILEAQLAPIR